MSATEQSQVLQLLEAHRDVIASAWYRSIAETSFVSLPAVEAHSHLLGLTDQAIACLLAEPFDRRRARAIGNALARLHYIDPEVLDRTQEVLGYRLVECLPLDQVVKLQPRLVLLLGGLATGFFAQARDMILAEQEQIRSADLTERQLIEKALRESQASLAEAQRIAHFGHWEYNLTKDELRWSDEVYRIFGVNPHEFDGTLDSYLGRLHPDDRAAFQKVVRESFRVGQFNFDHRIVRADGEIRTVQQSGEVIFDPDGNPAKVVGTVHDITERKALESTQYLQDFLTMVAHDLRQPLTILLGRIQMLQMLVQSGTGNLSEAEQRSLAAIEDTGGRILRLVSDLQDAAYIGAHRFGVYPGPMDLVETTRHIVEQQQSTTTVHRLHMEAPEHLRGKWDRDRIGQLLSNLISNAIKYSPEGCEVKVGVHKTGHEAVISVSDAGIGISPEHHELIFRSFSQVAPEQMRGRGLGLYISKAIVEAHGGRIWVQSESNEGSTFFVALPLE